MLNGLANGNGNGNGHNGNIFLQIFNGPVEGIVAETTPIEETSTIVTDAPFTPEPDTTMLSAD